MSNMPLDIYNIYMPPGMRSYTRAYGLNFNKKACELAVKEMKRLNPATGKKERVEPMQKEQVEELLQKYNIKLEHNKGHNFVFVANMVKAGCWKSSIDDEQHLAKMVKDIIDDTDNPGGNVFRKWLADCDAKEVVVDWEELL